jgi:Xaa-Pro aminopeptidase
MHSGYSHHIGHEIRNQAINVNEFIRFLNALDMAMMSLGMVVVVENGSGLLAGQYKREAVTNTVRLSRIRLHLPYDHLTKITLLVSRFLPKNYRRRHPVPLYVVLLTT